MAVRDRLDWTELATLALVLVFFVTLAVTVFVARAVVWLGWGAAMVLLAGGLLVVVNRWDDPPDRSGRRG